MKRYLPLIALLFSFLVLTQCSSTRNVALPVQNVNGIFNKAELTTKKVAFFPAITLNNSFYYADIMDLSVEKQTEIYKFQAVSPKQIIEIMEKNNLNEKFAGLQKKLKEVFQQSSLNPVIVEQGNTKRMEVQFNTIQSFVPDIDPSIFASIKEATGAEYSVFFILHKDTKFYYNGTAWLLFIPYFFTKGYGDDLKVMDVIVFENSTGKNIYKISNMASTESSSSDSYNEGLFNIVKFTLDMISGKS